MTTYLVTTELKTTWWLKILRFFLIKDKRKEFNLAFKYTFFEKDDILNNGNCKIRIIKRL